MVEDADGAISKALANPDFGEGGATQIFIENAPSKVRLVGKVPLEGT